jgi:hypothetical protein
VRVLCEGTYGGDCAGREVRAAGPREDSASVGSRIGGEVRFGHHQIVRAIATVSSPRVVSVVCAVSVVCVASGVYRVLRVLWDWGGGCSLEIAKGQELSEAGVALLGLERRAWPYFGPRNSLSQPGYRP